MYMKIAWVVASQSTAQKRKVGAIIVQDDNIISIGFNGTSPGEDNCCEDANGNTKPEVVHAEDNACKKLERSRQSAVGAEVFVTKIPVFWIDKRQDGSLYGTHIKRETNVT